MLPQPTIYRNEELDARFVYYRIACCTPLVSKADSHYVGTRGALSIDSTTSS